MVQPTVSSERSTGAVIIPSLETGKRRERKHIPSGAVPPKELGGHAPAPFKILVCFY